MPQLQKKSRAPDLSLLNSLIGARDTIRSTIFGDAPSFLEKLSAVDARMKAPGIDPITDEVIQELVMGFTPMGMAKVFKPGPSTLEGLIRQLAKVGQKLSTRERLIPAIRHPQTGEIFAGSMGGSHPHREAVDVLTRRLQSVPGTLQFGYQIPGQSPFIPEAMAGWLQSSGPQEVAKLLDKGISIDIILDLIKKGGIR